MKKGLYLYLSLILLLSISVNAELRRVTKPILSDEVRNGTRPPLEINTCTPGNEGPDLWKAFLGENEVPSGVSNLSARFTTHWAGNQVGTTKNMPDIGGIFMKDGIILSSGKAKDAAGPNSHTSKSGEGGFPGDADLTAAAGYATYDAAVLEIRFTTDATVEGFTFTFSFGTEEYPEFIGTKFNDVFLCLFNGRNICKDFNGNLISLNSALFQIDNNVQDFESPVHLEWDGFTFVLNATEPLSPGNHVLKFAACDASDYRLDAGVFLSDFKFELDTLDMVPQVNIVEPETLTVAPTTIGGMSVGTITNYCTKFSPVTCYKISGSNQFELDNFDVKTASGCNLEAGDEFTITVVGELDTLWNGKTWNVKDTAEIVIKVEGSAPWPELDSATILDSDGDGVGDSIEVYLEYKLPTEYSLAEASFEWGGSPFTPTLSSGDLNSAGDIIEFSFNNSNDYHTFGTESISITIDSLGEACTHSGSLKDGIGPILINEAILEERLEAGPDTLTVSVSEKVNVTDLDDKEFILRKGSASGSKVTLTLIETATNPDGNRTDIKFICEDMGNQSPEEGDYIQINPAGSLRDDRDNSAHSDNTPVPIRLNRKEMAKIDESTIFDTDADGKADSISITFDKAIDFDKLSSIEIEFPKGSGDKVILNKSDFDEAGTKKITSAAFEMNTLNTVGSGDLEIIFDSLGSDVERTGTIDEEIAPVIIKATLIDSVKTGAEDRLTVEFSESIKDIDEAQPFKLFSVDENKKFDATLDKISQSATEATFRIEELTGVDTVKTGDSIQCNWNSSNVIEDTKGNKQENEENRLCEINVITIEEGIKIVDALYEDRDANGRIETIVLTVYGEYESYLDEIMDELDLPSFREFSIDSYESSGEKVTINVTQDISEDEINTATSDQDLITVSDTVSLPDEMILLPVSVEIKDRMAPVIMSAALLDSIESSSMDILTLQFSEAVTPIDKETPFVFYDGTDEYEIKLEEINNSGTEAQFSVLTKGQIEDGDSIHIEWNPDDCVVDSKGNNQDNRENIKRPISVKIAKNEIKLTKAIYYDRDADGKIGHIKLTFEGEQIANSIDEIVKHLVLPKERKFPSIGSDYDFDNDVVTLQIEQDIDTDEINTATNSSDKIVIEDDVELNEKSRLLAGSVSAVDSVAPIIMKATMIDYVKNENTISSSSDVDSLFLTFSEEILETESIDPFKFFSRSEDEAFDAEVHLLSVDKKKAIYRVDDILDGIDEIIDGDSIWIHWESSSIVKDTNEIAQKNSKNIKRPIEVTRVESPMRIEWEACATILDLDGSDSYDNEEIMRITVQPKGDTKELLTSQDDLEGSVTIIDKVGNIIAEGIEMEFQKDDGLLLLKWDGKNSQERTIGRGGYLAIITGKRYFDFTTIDIIRKVEDLGPFTIGVGVEE